MSFKERIRRFFNPPSGSPRWMFILPYTVLAILVITVVYGGAYGWEYTNSPGFCADSCHTMPPQGVTYKISPHANVYCTECHIGRAFVGEQFARKSEDIRELYATVFKTYEFPLRAHRSKPDVLTCEKCHLPETFVDDSLRTTMRFNDDTDNSAYTTYLIMKTGGGAKREGLGRGIHWHIVNPVYYYSEDPEKQEIPYVRVLNDDGTMTEYIDVESDFDPASVSGEELKIVECTTCHNRVSHEFNPPEVSVDQAMSRGLISPDIPEFHLRAVAVLSASYETRGVAMSAIDGLETYYQDQDFYPDLEEEISQAVQEIRNIYDRTVFLDQEVDWNTHPDNIGHIYSPGCFRCHDGKHLDDENQAIRLECNVCHSIPVVVDDQDFVANIEISRGPEPESHFNPNWIAMHRDVFDTTCSNCHTTEDPGGTSNTSFCSNSACHGSVYTYAGFDAPTLREILQDQFPPPPAEAAPADADNPTFDAYVGALFTTKCTVCHGATASAGLNLSTYADTMKGSDSGPVIVEGDSASSLLVKVQSGQHFATFSTEELEVVKKWIDSGVPEN